MARNRDYWKQRFENLEDSLLSKGDAYLIDLEREYKKATSQIEKDITIWYHRIADNNGISFTAAKKLLNKDQLEEFHWTVDEYIKYGELNSFNEEWMKELENASAKVHISRLESLKLQLQQQVEVLYGNHLDRVDNLVREIYTEGYYQTAYEIQKGFNLGWSFSSLEPSRIDSVLSKPWAADGLDFSSRIWKDKAKLTSELSTLLTQSMIRGDGPDKLIRVISQKFNTSKSNAGRLVQTESAFFASAAQKDCFNDLGVEKYEIIATLDSRTSEICRALDGKVFLMSDYKVGDTAPPFHVRCRTCTAPYFEDEVGFRAARGIKDEVYYIPSSMKYPEWHEKFIANRSMDDIMGLKMKEIKLTGKFNSSPSKLKLDDLSFDDKHINKERRHNITKEEALSFINNAKFSITRWNGEFENFISEDGTAYVSLSKKEIKTAYKNKEYDKKIKTLLKEWKKHEGE